ncbi:MAG TPA: MBL fold metallo-hydrolase [Armatimonadota bacterium]|jgi:glyoxylase-like metal-dependent hydrolase (beta-lactamase superfamily II)
MASSCELHAIGPDFWLIRDTCNVYLLKDGEHAIAVDFGSGAWLPELAALGIRALDHVFLTHHHPDQCAGLLDHAERTFLVHAPAGEEACLSPEGVAALQETSSAGAGCPSSYAVLPHGIPGVQYDMAGFSDLWWRGRRIRFLLTPGHGPFACSVLFDQGERQVLCCGDAAHAGGTVWQPFHLEWDHWTGSGALAAWEGVQRVLGMRVDLLCPSHGPVIDAQPRQMLQTLADRLLAFYHAKGAIAADEPDRYLAAEPVTCGALRYLPHLYQFGGNGYLLVSASGEGLVVDPTLGDLPALERLLAEVGVTPTALTVSHYHLDHCDAIPTLQARYGAKAWLHPQVAAPLADPSAHSLPWLPSEPITADGLWPEHGVWRWQEYSFEVTHWPGQTWWHCGYQTTVDGQRVFFAGDSFQPASRWNGTGGFCAYNNSRFAAGFIPSARLIQAWQPDVVAAGHGCCYAYAAPQFAKIQLWAELAQRAVTALCPSGDLERDYYRAAEEIRAHRG